jgi:hypothetical protein
MLYKLDVCTYVCAHKHTLKYDTRKIVRSSVMLLLPLFQLFSVVPLFDIEGSLVQYFLDENDIK